jgi:hypothetical protein
MQIPLPLTFSCPRYIAAYKAMALRVERGLGLPADAVPQLSSEPTRLEIKEARDQLELIIQSFLSAQL